jgi:hypothetical protein
VFGEPEVLRGEDSECSVARARNQAVIRLLITQSRESFIAAWPRLRADCRRNGCAGELPQRVRTLTTRSENPRSARPAPPRRRNHQVNRPVHTIHTTPRRSSLEKRRSPGTMSILTFPTDWSGIRRVSGPTLPLVVCSRGSRCVFEPATPGD